MNSSKSVSRALDMTVAVSRHVVTKLGLKITDDQVTDMIKIADR